MKTIVDPPSGWMYGFPKEWDKEKYSTLKELLLDSSYPKEDIEFAISYIRMWAETEEDDEKML